NLPGKAGTPENDPIENFTKLAIPFLEIDEREALEPISLRVKGSSDNREKKMVSLIIEDPVPRIKQPQEIACSSNEGYPVHVLASDETNQIQQSESRHSPRIHVNLPYVQDAHSKEGAELT
ncbi:5933_t:CDS:2, partial [Racocetra fulgida]